MSKKSKKRKHKKLSSSSEEDDKSSKDHDATKHHKSGKRKQDSNREESHARKQDNCDFPKDISQSTRHIKKPVYRLAKTQATDQNPVYKEEECRKPKSDISGRNNTANVCTTVERGPSKPSNTGGTVHQRKEKTFKFSSGERSSQSSPSKIKKQRMSPSLVSAEQKEERPSRTSAVLKDSLQKKRRELVKKMCQRHQENRARKSPCSEAKTPSVSTTMHSSTSAKQNTPVSSSDVVKNVTSVSHKKVKSSPAQQQICCHTPPLPLHYKIPKKVKTRPVQSNDDHNGSFTNRNLKYETKRSDSGASKSNFLFVKETPSQQAHSCLDVTPGCSSEEQDKRSSLSGQLPATSHTITELWYDQMQVVEELHLARSEKKLEVNVMASYGDLTCMDIDPPEESAVDNDSKQPPQQDLILVLDTNILLSHLDYVKNIRSHGLGDLCFPTVLIPWVVLQELDSLKSRRGLSGSVAHLATPAISYIYDSLKNRGPRLWGQSMQLATESSGGLTTENNDDKVLQCCLQYQSLYPESAHILCTNDKNLCSKAILSGVDSFSKSDLESEFGRSKNGSHPLRNIKTLMVPNISPHVSSLMHSRSYTPVQPHSQGRAGLSVEKDNKQLCTRKTEEETKWDPSSVSELEDCLREVLSDVLEVEMKAAFNELWLEIVYIKPPWTLQDVLQCLKKHWIAVFGQIVPRHKLQTVLNLIHFFSSGETADRRTTSTALREAKELVKVFGKSSSHVPSALSTMDNIYTKLQPQWESPACDVVMNDNDGDKQPTSARVSHQEVWALFENIWSSVCQTSLEVFKALGFDPHTMQSTQAVGGPPPPQDALVFLHKLSSMVSQLLQAFSSILFSTPGLEEVQTLIGIILSYKIVDMDSRMTPEDLLDCFSQQDYREKLRFGGTQLMQLKEALDRCAGTMGQHIAMTTSSP